LRIRLSGPALLIFCCVEFFFYSNQSRRRTRYETNCSGQPCSCYRQGSSSLDRREDRKGSWSLIVKRSSSCVSQTNLQNFPLLNFEIGYRRDRSLSVHSSNSLRPLVRCHILSRGGTPLCLLIPWLPLRLLYDFFRQHFLAENVFFFQRTGSLYLPLVFFAFSLFS